MKTLIKYHYHQHKETIHNFIWRSLQIFGKQGITFLIFILCAKLLTPYDFGIYNYALAIILFLIMFGDFGISTATSKYVAEYNVTNKNKLKAVLFNSGIIILGLTILITTLTLIFGPMYLKEKYIYVLYLLPLIFLAPMTSLYDGIYRGLKKFKSLAIISAVVGLLSLSFVYYFVKAYDLIGALIAQNLFYLILLIGLGLGYRDFHFKWDFRVFQSLSRYSFIYGVALFGNFFFYKINTLLLGHYGYITEIAVYELVNRFLMILLLPFTILGQVIAPNFSIYAAKRQYKKIYNSLIRYTILFLFIGIFMGLFSYLILPKIINLFFSQYSGNIFFQILPILIITLIFYVSAATIDLGIIVSTGYAGIMAYSYFFIGLLNLICSLISIHKFGYIGPLISTLIFTIILTLTIRILIFIKIRASFNVKGRIKGIRIRKIINFIRKFFI